MRGIERSEMAPNVRHVALYSPVVYFETEAELHGAISLHSIPLIRHCFAMTPSPARGKERAAYFLVRLPRFARAGGGSAAPVFPSHVHKSRTTHLPHAGARAMQV